jgi:hypothetical protein
MKFKSSAESDWSCAALSGLSLSAMIRLVSLRFFACEKPSGGRRHPAVSASNHRPEQIPTLGIF